MQAQAEPEPHSDSTAREPYVRSGCGSESRTRSIVEQARNGADFGKLAITYSADQQALKGGQMGWGRIQELPSLFAQALSTAKGDIVGPIRSGVGFHILKSERLRGPGPKYLRYRSSLATFYRSRHRSR